MNFISLRPTHIFLLITALLCGCGQEHPQADGVPPELSWQLQETTLKTGSRGISTPDDNTIWVGSQRGQYALSTNGGGCWAVRTVEGADSLDFRDVAAFSAQNAFLMSAGPGERSRIYKTVDGGSTWTLQYRESDPNGFLNAIAFWSPESALAVGDPIGGRLFLLRTADGGANWTPLPRENCPEMAEGEYGFAASGTNLAVGKKGRAWIATGGTVARVLRSSDYGQTWMSAEVPLQQGAPAKGIFSLFVDEDARMWAVGGDYQTPQDTSATLAFSENGGVSWQRLSGAGMGYRSCIVRTRLGGKSWWIAAGSEGSSASRDGRRTWFPLQGPGFHTLSVGPGGTVWAAGADGRIGRLVALIP